MLEEYRKLGQPTGVFVTITDEDVERADDGLLGRLQAEGDPEGGTASAGEAAETAVPGFASDADEEQKWITLENGTHVPVGNGKIVGGPSGVKGKPYRPQSSGKSEPISKEAAAEYSRNKRNSLPPQASAGMKNTYFAAIHSEPEITNVLQDITSQTNGRLEGLDFRVKEGDSFLRKCIKDAEEKNKSAEQVAESLYDGVRYTQVSNVESFSSNTRKTIDSLCSKGYNIAGIKNTIGDADAPYRGINVKIETPQGQRFELQFHTQQSLEIKEANHKLHEQRRVLSKDDPAYERLSRKMTENARLIQTPPGSDTLR